MDLPGVIKVTCPKHGPSEFFRVEFAEWYMCKEGMNAPLGKDDPNYCPYVVPDEEFTPDGVTVVDAAVFQ